MTIAKVDQSPVAGKPPTSETAALAWRRAWRRSRVVILGLLSVALLIACWQLVYDFALLNRTFVPRPWAVLVALGQLFTDGQLWHNLSVSGEEFGIGLGISIGIGAILGIASGWYKPLEEFLRPLVIAVNSMPQVALVPLLILLFGVGITSKIVVVILSCAVTIILNTATGVENADPKLLRLSRSLGASPLQIIRTIILPSVIPFFMTGVRISVGRAVVGVVVGEIFASRAGLGYLLINASNSFDMPLMYATMVLLTALGILLTQGAGYLERRMQRWRE